MMNSRFVLTAAAAIVLLTGVAIHSSMASAVLPEPSLAVVTAEKEIQEAAKAPAEAESSAVTNANATDVDEHGEKQWLGGCARTPCQTHAQCCKNFYCSFTVMVFGSTGFCASYADLKAPLESPESN